MHDILVRPLCKGSRLTCIFDSCHSGTALDLPYVKNMYAARHGTDQSIRFVYSTKGVIKDQNLFKDAGKGLISAGISYASGDTQRAISSLIELGKGIFAARDVEEEQRQRNFSEADVIMFSGCKDDQTSADAQEAGKATGAMSYAFTSKYLGAAAIQIACSLVDTLYNSNSETKSQSIIPSTAQQRASNSSRQIFPTSSVECISSYRRKPSICLLIRLTGGYPLNCTSIE